MIPKIMAIDYGTVRTGVAISLQDTRILTPYSTLQTDETLVDKLKLLIDLEAIQQVIVGIPRNMKGNETAQTRIVYKFIASLKERLTIPVVVQDEAASSIVAENRLKERGGTYEPGDIDAMAAVIIGEDFMEAL